MLLAEMKIKVYGEYEKYDENEEKFQDALDKLESYAEQLFGEEWAKGLKLEVDS